MLYTSWKNDRGILTAERAVRGRIKCSLASVVEQEVISEIKSRASDKG